MSIDFDKLEKNIAAGSGEASKRAVLAELSDSNDPRAKKILENLARDKSMAIKLLASSYIKKNFSEGAQPENSSAAINSVTAGAKQTASSVSSAVYASSPAAIFCTISLTPISLNLSPRRSAL